MRMQYCLSCFVLLLFVKVPVNVSQTFPVKEVKIGVILTYATGRPYFEKLPFTMEMILPAIKYAVEKIEISPPSGLFGVKFILNERDSNCSNSNGPLAAIDFYSTNSAHVFLGPACDYAVAPVARYSGRWGIPVITAGALFQSFSDKNEFKLLTRVQGSFHKFSEMLKSALSHFNWTRIGLIYREDGDFLGGSKGECLQILRPVFEMFSKPPGYARSEEPDPVDWGKHVAAVVNNSRTYIPATTSANRNGIKWTFSKQLDGLDFTDDLTLL